MYKFVSFFRNCTSVVINGTFLSKLNQLSTRLGDGEYITD